MPEPVKRFLGIAASRWRMLWMFVLTRASQPGSIRQMVLMSGTLVGIRIAPEQAEAIGWIGLAAAVAIGILTDEDKPPPDAPPEGQA